MTEGSTSATLLAARMQQATSRIVKAVFPNATNHYDTMFGGTALSYMDEVAFITATRFSRKKVVTVSSDRVDFKHPIPSGRFVEFIGQIVSVGRTSVKVSVDVFVEDMYSEQRIKAIHGQFTLVSLDEQRRPIAIVD